MRNIPESFDPQVVAAIDQRLETICKTERVNIALAIESGSRAWGFPSPDSDYDCRFIYIRQHKDYLTLWPARDVIETPLEGELDVSGWDLAKALKLMVDGNATVLEWLQSPIVYCGNAAFKADFLQLAGCYIDKKKIAYHYFHLGKRAFSDMCDGEIRLKKLFYALRPALALQWLRQHQVKNRNESANNIVPMHFPTLMKTCDISEQVRVTINELLELKKQTREMGKGKIPDIIGTFLTQAFNDDVLTAFDNTAINKAEFCSVADDFFRHWVLK